MRDILFRAKREDNGEWAYGYYVCLPDVAGSVSMLHVPARNPDESNKTYYVKKSTVGQFTGLTDKNGVKIFEGDIVRYGDTIHKVVFEQRNGTAYFGLVYSPIETLPFGHYQDLRQLEVIGSIYDNPELIGGGENG